MAQIAGFRGALWASSGELVRDPTRAMYLYLQTFTQGGRPVTRRNVLAAVRLVPWSEGIVRPHAAADPAARERVERAIAKDRLHTEPVLLGYRDAAREVDRLFRKTEDDRPAVDTTTGEGTRHRLWRMTSAEVMGKLRPLFAPKKLHVLAGHARYEAMLAVHDQLAAAQPLAMYSSASYGLACLVNVEDPALVSCARHRILRGQIERDAVLDKARAHFLVDKLAGAAKDVARQRTALADTVAHQPAFIALFAGDPDAYKLTLSPDVSLTALGVPVHRALQKYDPVVIEHLFLQPAVAGAARETTLDPAAVVGAVGDGAELGVIARALTTEQILHVDELGQLLPAASTGFAPDIAKLLAYVVDRDEDLV